MSHFVHITTHRHRWSEHHAGSPLVGKTIDMLLGVFFFRVGCLQCVEFLVTLGGILSHDTECGVAFFHLFYIPLQCHL